MKGISKTSYKTFIEEPIIKKSFEAKKFIKDYGVDGEKLLSYSEGRQIVHRTKKTLRLYCRDCPEVKECKGEKWATCENRIYLLTAINKYLAGENKGLEEDIRNYKEILGEKED